MRLGFVQKQVPDGRRISNKTTLTLTLSRPTGEGTARPVSRSFQSGWIRRPTEDDSPSPIRPRLRRRLRRGEWERAGPSPRRRRRAVAGAFPPSPLASARSRRSEAETEARREGGSVFRAEIRLLTSAATIFEHAVLEMVRRYARRS